MQHVCVSNNQAHCQRGTLYVAEGAQISKTDPQAAADITIYLI
jgi:hypothetical protein